MRGQKHAFSGRGLLEGRICCGRMDRRLGIALRRGFGAESGRGTEADIALDLVSGTGQLRALAAIRRRKEQSVSAHEFVRSRIRFRLTLAGSLVSTFRSARDIYISYGTGAPLPFLPLASGSLGEHGPAIIFNKDISVGQPALPKADHAYPNAILEDGITQFTIGAAKQQVVLATGPIAPAMKALRHCTDELLASWGLDPAVQAKLSSPVTPLNAEAVNALITADDPPEAVRRLGGIARLRLRVMVDATGAPTGCKTSATDGVPEFEVNSCDIVMRSARYSPALDEHGRPVESYFMTAIVFATNEFFRRR